MTIPPELVISLVALTCLLTVLPHIIIRFISKPATISAKSVSSLTDTGNQKPDWNTLDFSTTKPLTDFDWRNQHPKPYRPWSNGPHYVTMGLKKTTIHDWVEIDNQYLDRYRYKRKLYAEHPHDTVQFLPDSYEPSLEALLLLVEHLVHRYPTMFVKLPFGIHNLVVDEVWDLRKDSEIWKSYHPLQVMGLLTTEDWFIMQTDENQQTRLRAGANCFPAGWKLRERIGLSLWDIHAGKVPQYEKNLSKSMDRFFVRLRVDSPIMRFNYAIDDSPELFHIHSHHNLKPEDLEKPLTLKDLHLRVERQFLQRLPETRAIVFSIRTYVTPITEVTKDKERALALQTSINSFSPEVSIYKNKPLWNDIMQKHLEEVTKV